MLKFKKELNELINSLIKENNDFSAKTGTCYEYGGIFYSFITNLSYSMTRR